MKRGRRLRGEIGLLRWLVGWTLILLGVAALMLDTWGMFTQRTGETGWYQDTGDPTAT